MKKFSILLILCSLLFGCNGNAQKKENSDKDIAVIQPEKLKGHDFPMVKTDAVWKEELTTPQYNVLREATTERPNSSPLLHIKGKGVFICAACGNPVYRNENQFESGTGWPSFDQPVKAGVVLSSDNKLGYKRNEILCSRCGGHLGHRFSDGPRKTTGLRYCMNGAAMKFIPADKKSEDEIIKEHQLTKKK